MFGRDKHPSLKLPDKKEDQRDAGDALEARLAERQNYRSQGMQESTRMPLGMESALYTEIHRLRREMNDLSAKLDLLTRALGFEIYHTDYVPAQDSKLDIRKKAK